MAISSVFTKSLPASVSNGIAQSQSASAGVPLTLNGSLTDYLSTTTTAAVALNGVTVPLSSVSGVEVGQEITDTTTPSAIVGTALVVAVGANGVTIWPPVGGPGVGSGDTIVFPGTATIDSVSSNDLAIGQRVVITYTGTDTSFVITGTNSTGNIITDTAVGNSGTATSNLDFVTVTSITPVGGGLTGVVAGTNEIGSSPWWVTNPFITSVMNVSFFVEVISGSINYSIQYTYDDPNNPPNGIYPTPIVPASAASQTSNLDGVFDLPIKAINVLINSGTGAIRTRFNQSSIG